MSEVPDTSMPTGAGAAAPLESGVRGNAVFDEGKIFLGGLSHSTTRASLEAYCKQWGSPKDICVMDTKGYGFVTFVEMNDAFRFLEHPQHLIDGRNVDVKAAMPKSRGGSKDKGKKMFIGALPRDVDEETLRSHFQQFGVIEECNLVHDTSRGPKGFAFITWQDPISMEKALIVRHTFGDRSVECKRALSKEEHEAAQANRGGISGASAAGGPAPRGGRNTFGADGKYLNPMAAGGGMWGGFGGYGGYGAQRGFEGGYGMGGFDQYGGSGGNQFGGGYGGGYGPRGGGYGAGPYEQRGGYGQNSWGQQSKGPLPGGGHPSDGGYGGQYGYGSMPEPGGYGGQYSNGPPSGYGGPASSGAAGPYSAPPGAYSPTKPSQGPPGQYGSQVPDGSGYGAGAGYGPEGGYGGHYGGYGGAPGGRTGGSPATGGPPGAQPVPAAHQNGLMHDPSAYSGYAPPPGGYGGAPTGVEGHAQDGPPAMYGGMQPSGYGGASGGGYSGHGYGGPHGTPAGGYGGPMAGRGRDPTQGAGRVQAGGYGVATGASPNGRYAPY